MNIYPQSFAAQNLSDPLIRKIAEFFEAKGLARLKVEDQNQQWYPDWIEYQKKQRIYATALSPKQFSAFGGHFDLLRYTRLLEVFAFFSPAHGYSLQVTFLGLFAILMGDNEPLKREAIAALEAGGLLAFGVSEKEHGSDLFGNEFTIKPTGSGEKGNFIANGQKYYIGNANTAAIVSILARKDDPTDPRAKRIPFVFFALRPTEASGYRYLKKIHTLGVRAADVGEFQVTNHPVAPSHIIAQGRDAWDALFGTVTLGKFFLGFASIGICERAFQEALTHVRSRILYNKPVLEMPHIRDKVNQAFIRLTAMKLFAYRALDYVHSASESERRYLLYNAVQKARVSTEGVKSISLLSECMGARGLESDTFFEMALRDAQLVPGLEGSTHINLQMAAQFAARYFDPKAPDLQSPKSLYAAQTPSTENSYLTQARTGATNTISFSHFLKPYAPLIKIKNVRLFARQAKAFELFLRLRPKDPPDTTTIALGHTFAIIAYAQLVAENAAILQIPAQIISTIFHTLILDLSTSALALAATLDFSLHRLLRRLLVVPNTPSSDWDFVTAQISSQG